VSLNMMNIRGINVVAMATESNRLTTIDLLWVMSDLGVGTVVTDSRRFIAQTVTAFQ
jgi:hypothetical protein